MILDRAVNQRFSAQDTQVKISGSSHMNEKKCAGIMKWYMQMPMWDTGSLSLESVSAFGLKSVVSHGERQQVTWRPTGARTHSEPSDEYPTGREVEKVLSGTSKIRQHGMVKSSKGYGLICLSSFVSLRHYFSPSISLTPQKLRVQEEDRERCGYFHSL